MRRGVGISQDIEKWKVHYTRVDIKSAEFVQSEVEVIIDVLTLFCNTIWKPEEWPTAWIRPIERNLVAVPISLISYPSKVVSKLVLNRLQPHAEDIIAEEQADFWFQSGKEHQGATI